ncbi:D-arabinono-1,4-lactone oxidase [Okibacterium endophyticum]
MTATGDVWRNWARTEQIRPLRVERPASTAAVQRAVKAAAGAGVPIKAVGAGHSFSGIAVAPGVMLDLDDLSGIVDVDPQRGYVTFGAGTRMHRIPRMLARHGLAMENLGDVDRQSLAGALATGTHGTGLSFGGLSTQVRGVTIVTASGETMRIDASHHAELLPALALSLGALGVITDVTLECVPRFALQAVERAEPVEHVLDSARERATGSHHFEFFWFPHTSVAVTKTNTRLQAGPALKQRARAAKMFDENVLQGGLFLAACALGSVVPALVPPVNSVAARLMANGEYSDWSHRVLTSRRTVRFREMEYALPADLVADAVREIRRTISAHRWRISFPIEVRFARGDDLWLSTATGRETAYIAVHRYHREDESAYFAAVEAVMRGYGARPHWGKLHGLDATELAGLYPRFNEFIRLRNELDPGRMFANPYLSRVLGE